MLDGSRSGFACEEIDDIIRIRLDNNELHPTGALYGEGDLRASADAQKCEQSVLDEYESLTRGLIAFGLETDRRALRVNVQDLTWQLSDENTTLLLKFSLPAGSYATAVLREIMDV
jgi:tRNA pseudouridine13 synthase